jgi:hypothetical protein
MRLLKSQELWEHTPGWSRLRTASQEELLWNWGDEDKVVAQPNTGTCTPKPVFVHLCDTGVFLLCEHVWTITCMYVHVVCVCTCVLMCKQMCWRPPVQSINHLQLLSGNLPHGVTMPHGVTHRQTDNRLRGRFGIIKTTVSLSVLKNRKWWIIATLLPSSLEITSRVEWVMDRGVEEESRKSQGKSYLAG